MAWPFSSVGAPNLDTGLVEVPTSPTFIASGEAWIVGAHFKNSAAGERRVTIADGGGVIFAEVILPEDADHPYEWPFRPVIGIQWFADDSDVSGQIWGYE